MPPLRIARVPDLTAGPLAPFGDAPADCPIMGRPLRETQQAAADLAGAALTDCPDLATAAAQGIDVAIAAPLYVTAEFLRWLSDQRTGPGRRRAQLAAGTAHHDQVCARAPDHHGPRWLDAWAGDLAHGEDSPAVLDDDDADEVRVDPYGPPPHRLRIPTPAAYAAPLTHWLDLLDVNLAALSQQRARLGTGNRKAAGVKIHPSAHVEGSVLEAGARIDAGASVIGCHVGAGAQIGQKAVFDRCVVGAGCSTLIDTHFRRCVFFPGSTLSSIGETDIIMGQGAFITSAVSLYARLPGLCGTVEGAPSRRPIVGLAIGHRAILGARALFSAGLSVPNDTIIVMRPDEGATKLDDDGLARAHMLRGTADDAV